MSKVKRRVQRGKSRQEKCLWGEGVKDEGMKNEEYVFRINAKAFMMKELRAPVVS